MTDADVSTVGGAADKVLRVESDPPYLLHLDFFAGHDTAWPAPNLLWYNAALSRGAIGGGVVEESTTYQEITKLCEAEGYARGVLIGVRRGLCLVGEVRFGSPPDAVTKATIDAIGNLERLKQLVLRALEVNSWQELLHPLARPRRPRGRRSSQ